MSSSPAAAAAVASSVAPFHPESYLNPQGPGDARPTAAQVVLELNPDRSLWRSAVVMITGCSSGIGVETARAFLTVGAQVYLPVRSADKMKAITADLLATPGVSGAQLTVLSMDLSSLASVRQCAAEFLRQSKGQLNLLINNAGIMATPEGKTVDGFETQFGTNHLGHFLLTQLLLPALQSSSTAALPSRVVCLSSVGHSMSPVLFGDYDLSKRGYDRWIAYGQSKTANIYLATEIERRFGAGDAEGKGVVHALAVHPGGIMTNLLQHVGEVGQADLDAMGLTAEDWANFGPMFKSVPQGAATTVWAALHQDFNDHTKAGKYCEDTSVTGPKDPNVKVHSIAAKGHAAWAYDQQAAKQLWEESIKMVGL